MAELLLQSNRRNDLTKSLHDLAYPDRLYKQYNI